ncbi:hypothetical protein EY915_17530 [Citrobacter braakii]|uniref:glucosyltransferase domain-containing protein n=1 Tax=Citrobacter braakii TaxID=57706 RepID=UPI00103CA6D9|nr:glucosyltransferase domain-containing protein [Citrobacter braakii]TCC78121.1 hypothetical protein EY915_17530 [Citrobacter braakii]
MSLKNIDNIMRDMNLSKYLTSIMVLFYIPLIIFDIPFRDDLSRLYGSYIDLFLLGRPAADIVFSIISFGSPGPNLSPLPKIISLAFLCMTSIVIYRRFFESKGLVGALAVFLLLANPFILQNFAYQYDSLPMTMAIFLSSIAYCLDVKSIYKRLILITSLLFISLCLYQAGIIVCACLVICGILQSICAGKSLNELFVKNIHFLLAAIIAVLFYYFIIIHNNNQLSSRGELASLDGIFNNFRFISNKLKELYGSKYEVCVVILSFIIISCSLYLILNNKNSCAIFIPLLFIALVFVSLLPSGILKEGFVGPRTLMALGSLWIALAIVFKLFKVPSYIILITFLILLSNSFMIAFGFTGELREQESRYNTATTQIINYTLNEKNNSYKTVHVHNKLSKSKQEKNYIAMNSFIDWMNPEEAWVFRFFLKNHGEDRVVNDWTDGGGDIPNESIDFDNKYFYSIKSGDGIHIILK